MDHKFPSSGGIFSFFPTKKKKGWSYASRRQTNTTLPRVVRLATRYGHVHHRHEGRANNKKQGNPLCPWSAFTPILLTFLLLCPPAILAWVLFLPRRLFLVLFLLENNDENDIKRARQKMLFLWHCYGQNMIPKLTPPQAFPMGQKHDLHSLWVWFGWFVFYRWWAGFETVFFYCLRVGVGFLKRERRGPFAVLCFVL